MHADPKRLVVRKLTKEGNPYIPVGPTATVCRAAAAGGGGGIESVFRLGTHLAFPPDSHWGGISAESIPLGDRLLHEADAVVIHTFSSLDCLFIGETLRLKLAGPRQLAS